MTFADCLAIVSCVHVCIQTVTLERNVLLPRYFQGKVK